MRRFKVGILGSGVISRTYAADIMNFYSHVLDLTACADIDASLAAKLASEFQIRKAYTTEELLADDEIEIVINLTPPQMHVPLAKQIIAAGKHLFSEKPFARTVAEAKEEMYHFCGQVEYNCQNRVIIKRLRKEAHDGKTE